MRLVGTTNPKGIGARLLSGYLGAALVLALSPVLLLLAGTSAEGDAYANVELGFSLLALAGGSALISGLVSNAHLLLLEAPLLIDSPLLRPPAEPEPVFGERPDERDWALPVVVPSLVLPTLISGLGGWVGHLRPAPRAEARYSAA